MKPDAQAELLHPDNQETAECIPTLQSPFYVKIIVSIFSS